MRRITILALLVGAAVLPAAAEEPTRADVVVATAAKRVRDALAAGDARALAELAAADVPDPWLVAEHLLSEAHGEAAGALAGRMSGPAGAALLAYVEARSAAPSAAPGKAALTQALAAVEQRGGEATTRSELRRRLAVALLAVDEIDAAMAAARRAAEEALAAKHGPLEGLALHVLGLAQRRAGQFDRAFDASARAVPLIRKSGRKRVLAEALGWLADSARLVGKLDGALAAAREEVALREVLGDAAAWAEAVRLLASTHHARGEYDEALALDRRALARFEEAGDESGAARVREGIGLLLERRGEFDAALLEMRAARKVHVARSDKRSMAVVDDFIAGVHASRGAYGKAIEIWTRTLKVLEALGEVPRRIEALIRLGSAFDAVGRTEEALRATRLAGSLAQQAGLRAMAFKARNNLARMAMRSGRLDESRAAFEAAAQEAQQLGRPDWVALALCNLANVLSQQGHSAAAERVYEQALPLARRGEDARVTGTIIQGLGVQLNKRGDWKGARVRIAEALAIYRTTHSVRYIGHALGLLGGIEMDHGLLEDARGHLQEAYDLVRGSEEPRVIAARLMALGNLHRAVGELDEAKARHLEARALYERAGDTKGAADAWRYLGWAYSSEGDAHGAVERWTRALAMYRELGNGPLVIETLRNLGGPVADLGRRREGMRMLEEARDLAHRAGDTLEEASAWINIGREHALAGALARAIDARERGVALLETIDAQGAQAVALLGLAQAWKDVGDLQRALACATRGADLLAGPAAASEKARAYRVMAAILGARGRSGESLAAFEEARRLSDSVGDEKGAAEALANIGTLQGRMGRHAAAIDAIRRSIAVFEKLGDPFVAGLYDNLGVESMRARNYDDALRWHRKALTLAEEYGFARLAVHSRANLALTLISLGRPKEALAEARVAAEGLQHVAAGLSVEGGAGMRATQPHVFDAGVTASIDAGDVEALAWFLESGRAGAMREALGGRTLFDAFELPAELRAEEAAARREEKIAAMRLRNASRRRRLAEARTARARLEAARGRVEEIARRIRRQAKASARIVHPTLADTRAMQAQLRRGDALVLYALTEEHEAVALVVTPAGTAMAELGPSTAVQAACEAVVLANPAHDPREAVAALRELVVDPLKLAPDTKRVLLSPHAALNAVPFALLLPDRDVAYVPSATVHGLLRAADVEPGRRVLALGDPDYEARGAVAADRARGPGERLSRLKQTRAEVEAVGDVRLLGKEATEGRLRAALTKEARWRALHLACHGLVDTQRPFFSSLAVTADAEDDGYLTCLEILRMKVPADLVVLSACDTARGRVFRNEGILGLTSAFLVAGASNVLCSQWKVDDAATRALMTKFYELWHPATGAGLPAATALRRAQAHVRAQERWRHPYYWAAWALWGRGD